ncbi:transposase family protein [Microcoleus anatoxicus]|uniref:Transposase family protein n=1 Tax=Microcoleus anatoxicus PTRS2 TaxID=2705321 RepID=A0ABU8YXT7_9CYAN
MSQLQEYIEKHPSETQRILGIDYDQLIQLIINAENLYAERKKSQESQKNRLIKPGSGRPPKLTTRDQILLTLVYLHNLPTFQMLGVQFDVGESTANYIFHRWVKVLRELLPASLLEQVKKNDSDRAWVREILSEVELIVDSYEHPIQRPTDNEEQKKNYSGKQKRHTKKNQVIVMPNGKEIVDVVVGETGATADIKIWRKQRLSLLTSQKFQGDKAYVGEPLINTPHKKPRQGVLTPAQNRANKSKAQKRIFVEHLIRLLKIFRVAAERFRLKAKNYDTVILVVCGLIRWRIGAIVMYQ